jgi:hypothetical protein
VPTIEYSLADLVSDLNDKIAELEDAKQTVQNEIEQGHRVKENQNTLDRINNSLSKANAGKQMLMDSCCSSQGCFFEYYT